MSGEAIDTRTRSIRQQDISHIELAEVESSSRARAGHRVDRASGGEHERIIAIEDRRTLCQPATARARSPGENARSRLPSFPDTNSASRFAPKPIPSPSNANNFVGIGSAHFGAGRYHAAAAWMRKALLEQPGTLWANRTLSASYARLGERLKALESLETLPMSIR